LKIMTNMKGKNEMRKRIKLSEIDRINVMPVVKQNSAIITPKVANVQIQPIIEIVDEPDEIINYDEYINSEDWRLLKQDILKSANFRCQLCSSGDKLRLHHNTYERLGHELRSDVVILCERCHSIFHGVSDERFPPLHIPKRHLMNRYGLRRYILSDTDIVDAVDSLKRIRSPKRIETPEELHSTIAFVITYIPGLNIKQLRYAVKLYLSGYHRNEKLVKDGIEAMRQQQMFDEEKTTRGILLSKKYILCSAD